MEKNTGDVIRIKKDALWKYATFVLAAVVIIGALFFFTGNNSATREVIQQPGATPTPPAQPSTVSADDDAFLGPEDAETVVIEFSDFQCPYCGAAMGTHTSLINQFKSSNPSWEPAVPRLKEFAKQGKIKFVYRDFPLSGHKNAQKAAEAAECAKVQGKFWEYHDVLFNNQDALEINSLKTYAQQLGLNNGKFNKCLDSGEMTEEVRKDFQAGQAAGVRGTPAFFVNGRLVSGAQPFSAFEKLIG